MMAQPGESDSREEARHYLLRAHRTLIQAQRLWQPLTRREHRAKVMLNHAIDDVAYAANLLRGEAFPP